MQAEFVSVGPRCITAMTLKHVGVRTVAYPFDWIFCSPKIVKHCIKTHFSYFLDPKYIETIKDDASDHTYYKAFLPNNAGPIFNHHDMADEGVRSCFVRRCARFMRLYTDRSKRMWLVFIVQNDEESERTREFNEICDFSRFVASDAAHVRVLTMILVKTPDVKPYHLYETNESHISYVVYYDELDNLADVNAILMRHVKTS